jgi:hypothetical protein
MIQRYKVAKGQKIRNVKDEKGNVRIYQSGEVLPECYVIPDSFKKQKIVELVKEETKYKGGAK